MSDDYGLALTHWDAEGIDRLMREGDDLPAMLETYGAGFPFRVQVAACAFGFVEALDNGISNFEEVRDYAVGYVRDVMDDLRIKPLSERVLKQIMRDQCHAIVEWRGRA